MEVRIYQPARNAMQSGRANTRKWVLEFEPTSPSHPEPLMGWIAGRDTRRQVKLRFETKEAAIAYAKKKGWDFQVFEPHRTRLRPKSYADNFRYDRVR